MTRVNYKGKNLYNFCGKFLLRPGVNEVAAEKLEVAMKHPIFSQRLKAGMIQIIGEMKSLPLAEMRSWISRTFSKEVLDKIAKEDGRAEVASLCSKQMDLIKHPKAGEKKPKLEDVQHFGSDYKGE